MKLPRRYRTLTAIVALFSVLFMQLAVASYACPSQQTGYASGAVSDAMSMQSMPDCDRPDPENPALCQAHCQDAKSSLDKPQSPTIAPAAFVISTILTPLDPLVPAPTSGIEPDWLLQRITSPPISIRHCCLRI